MSRRYTLGPPAGDLGLFILLDHGEHTGAYTTHSAVKRISDECEIIGGEFHGGWFNNGDFYGGKFYDGWFSNGVFRGGAFYSGDFIAGEYLGGVYNSSEDITYYTPTFDADYNSIPVVICYLRGYDITEVYPICVNAIH